MGKQDVLTLLAAGQEQIRRQAVRLYQASNEYADVARIVEANKNSFSRLCCAYEGESI